jgi:hypothetical protein
MTGSMSEISMEISHIEIERSIQFESYYQENRRIVKNRNAGRKQLFWLIVGQIILGKKD